jgi:hypothetical protein
MSLGDASGRNRPWSCIPPCSETSETRPLPDTSHDQSATPFRKGEPRRAGRLLLPNPGDPGTMLVPLSQGRFAIVDARDAEAVSRLSWSLHVSKHRRAVYAKANVRCPDGKWRIVRLHRFLWTLWAKPATPEIDHENGNGLDCRQDNLRPASHGQNRFNTPRNRLNRSGFKGVYQRGNRWTAEIGSGYRKTRLGTFATAEDASRAYQEAARAIHGEFARAA